MWVDHSILVPISTSPLYFKAMLLETTPIRIFTNTETMAEAERLFHEILQVIQALLKIVYLYLEQLVLLILPKTPKSLQGDVVLITGSASGLGKEICKKLATSGATLVLWDIFQNDNENTAQELKDMGAEHVYTDTVDISSRQEIAEAAARLRQNVGPVTILINNAGISPVRPFLKTRDDEILKTFDVNILAHFWTVREFLPDMIKANKGHVVAVCSYLGLYVVRGSACYAASKHAVHGLYESLRDEMRHLPEPCDNIKFTTVYPFFMKTNLINEEKQGFRLKMPIPWLTPFIGVDWAAEKIVDGILYNKDYVYLPNAHRIFHALSFFFTTKVGNVIKDLSYDLEYLTTQNESQSGCTEIKNGNKLDNNDNIYENCRRRRVSFC